MEAFVNFGIWCLSIITFVLSFLIGFEDGGFKSRFSGSSTGEHPWIFGLVLSIFLFAVYPIIQEGILALIQKIQKQSGALDDDLTRIMKLAGQKHYLVYNPDYNITAFGIEKMHPFDSQKYGRIFRYLLDQGIVRRDTEIFSPGVCPRMYLYEQCTLLHMILLNYSLYVTKGVEVPIGMLPGWFARWRALNPMLKATYGTIHAAIKAMEFGVGINLSGGYHHAGGSSGGGFCIYPDISIAIRMIRRLYNVSKVMIIDLDAHQGNGHERDFIDDNDVFIIDCFNPNIYPGDFYARDAIDKELHVYPSDEDDTYLDKLSCISGLIQQVAPEFIMYNAGTDIMIGDPLSGLNISAQGIIARDELVISSALEARVPVGMVLSGGYQRSNAKCIAQSIANINTLVKDK